MAGKKKGCFVVFMVLIGAGLFGANYWAVSGIGNGIREAILEETDFPPVLKGFTGVIPMGRFSADYLEAKTRIEENLLEIKTTDISLHLDPAKYLRELYEIRNLQVESVVASYAMPEENLSFQGRFAIVANSTQSGPDDNPPGSLWTEELKVRLKSLDANYRNRELNLLNKANLELLPVNFVPEAGLQGQTDFHFEGFLTPDETTDRVKIDGTYQSENQHLRVEASLNSLQFPPRVKWIDQWLQEGEGVQLADVISSGSVSYRIHGEMEGNIFKGEMWLRALRPRFGKALRDLAEDYPVAPLLDLLERQSETIELGPIQIDEDLSTPILESGALIIGGLTKEFFELSSQNNSGESLIDLFRKRRGGSSGDE
ncbi:MAG: hypothetical protein KC964_00105 [Candidatus Omnitrophica bacterium]|nr:hypothetical protein [Candidatus Omnitrophota bacterium]